MHPQVITVNIDDSEDNQIHCFTQSQPCKAGLGRLRSGAIQQARASDPFQDITVSAVEDFCPEEMLLDHDDDISDDVGI